MVDGWLGGWTGLPSDTIPSDREHDPSRLYSTSTPQCVSVELKWVPNSLVMLKSTTLTPSNGAVYIIYYGLREGMDGWNRWGVECGLGAAVKR